MQIRKIAERPEYGVSGDGRVWRIAPTTGCAAQRPLPYALRQHEDRDGYRYVILFQQGQRRKRLVHRLVLTAFRGPPAEGFVAAHNNGDPSDNRLENLRWDTQANNIADRDRHGTTARGTASAAAKLDPGAVRQIRDTYKRHANRRKVPNGVCLSLAQKYGVSASSVRNVARRKVWRHV